MDVYVRCERSTEGRIKLPLPDSIVVFICAYCKTRHTTLHLITPSEASCQGSYRSLKSTRQVTRATHHI